MLRITVELVPGGNEAKKRIIGVCHIVNIGDVGAGCANYHISEMTESGINPWKAFSIFRHLNVFRFLEALFTNKAAPSLPKRKKDK